MGEFLAIARITAAPDHDRWLVPPCALAIHLCIGMAYGFSGVLAALSHVLGTPACTSLGQALTSTACDWRVSDLVWVYSLFFVVLGLSAALFGAWVERVGPRRAGLVAACCWAGGMAIGAIGVGWHLLWLFWLGTASSAASALASAISRRCPTLLKWFPDRRGLATGMAIMGFGGGAMVAARRQTD